jgi:hypothetical protein
LYSTNPEKIGMLRLLRYYLNLKILKQGGGIEKHG